MKTATTYYITGTDTGVGKTTLTVLWARHLLASDVAVRAVKPFCSGGRTDARLLRTAQHQAVSLDAINPWHFRAPLAPLVAARQAGVRVSLAQTLAFLRLARRQCEVLLIEGAGGLLSPLGEQFSNRELIAALRAIPIVLCPNRLGAVNQVMLVLSALPKASANQARVVMVKQSKPDHSAPSNLTLLSQFLGRNRVQEMVRLKAGISPVEVILNRSLRVLLDHLRDR